MPSESWLGFRWRLWQDAIERRPPMILSILATLPALYAFIYGYLREDIQASIGLPWWVSVAYYAVLFVVHFEVGVATRIRELGSKNRRPPS